MKEIIIWDKDGTITKSFDPNDNNPNVNNILPYVEETMQASSNNFVISGFKSKESELQNYDPEIIIAKFTKLMTELPISAVAFSPTIGGVACYVLIKKDNDDIIIKQAHIEARYKQFIGEFKKPGIGMFAVIKDIAFEEFGLIINADNTVMIGDTWHDEKAATDFGIDFIKANDLHQGKYNG